MNFDIEWLETAVGRPDDLESSQTIRAVRGSSETLSVVANSESGND